MATHIIAIETATRICSVSISTDGENKAHIDVAEEGAHSSQLTLLISQLLKQTNLSMHDIAAVAISMGPGSYTGLRIGASTAKGICYATGKPLIAVSTLQTIAFGAIDWCKQQSIDTANALFCPMIDARRMEVYTALFSAQGEAITAVEPHIIEPHSFANQLLSKTVYFCGDGAEKCSGVISSPSAQFLPLVQTSAQWMSQLAYQKFCAQQFEDVAYFEPFYLKEFQTTTPKKKVLG